MNNRNIPLPAPIEAMIEGLLDPRKNRFMKDNHLLMMKKSIEALEEAIRQYENEKVFNNGQKM